MLNQPAPETGLIGYFCQNSVAVNLLMFFLLIGGLIAGVRLTAQVFPTIDPGIISITVPYPGATPSEVEEGITRRVEEAVANIDGVDRVVSNASENVGIVTVELKDFVDAMEVRTDVEAAVERLSQFPPEDAEQPEIERAQTVSDVITLVVSSQSDAKTLRTAAEQLEQSLLALPSVTLVSLMGAVDYEIAIEVNEENLRRYGLSIDQIAAAIQRSSINLASGELRTEAGDLLLRTNKKRVEGSAFADIVVRANSDGTLLRLDDVATIKDGFADVDVINLFNGQPSLFVKVQKSESEDALSIAADVKALFKDYTPITGVSVGIWDDETDILQQRLSLLTRNGVLGFALVFLFLVVMLDLRLATWVAMGVPISFLGAFLFFDAFGVNINMISLFGLIIVLGIVVDDAVVVGENIISEHEKNGQSFASTMRGVRDVLSPVTIGVLTTMAAFAPLLFVTGTFGQILGSVPIVVILVLSISLLEVFFIMPAHLSHGRAWSRWPLAPMQDFVAAKVAKFRDELLVPLVRLAIRRYKTTLAFGMLMLVIAGTLLGVGAVRFIFFPYLESDTIRASLEFPVGTPFATTQAAAERIVASAYRLNDAVGGTSFESVSVTIGGRTNSGGGPGGSEGISIASHVASVEVQLNSEPLRTLSAQVLERRWRQETGPIAGVEKLTFSATFFSSGPDLEYELSHQNDATLFAAVDALKNAYAEDPAVYDIQDSFAIGKRQYDVELTNAGEAAGLTATDIARQLRNNFFGREVQRIQRGRSELKVMVRYPRDQRESTSDLYNARISLPDGTLTPLATVARLTESRSFSSIRRVDGRRIVSVTGEVDTELATPTEANSRIAKRILAELPRQFPGLQIAQAGEGRDQSEDLNSIFRMLGVAMALIVCLIASLLRSYTQPLVILSSIPLGSAGAIIGHYLLGYDLSFISIFGMVALSGVVVNDSLVLIDRYNRLRKETNMTVEEAIVEACRRRFRAIFLTTATTALGLTPMLFETSTQAQFLIPMAVSLATGIVFASFLILLVLPALVVTLEKLRRTANLKVGAEATA